METPVKSLRVYKRANGVFMVYYKLDKEIEPVYGEFANATSITFPGEILPEAKNSPLHVDFAEREAPPYGYTFVRKVAVLWRKWNTDDQFMVKIDCVQASQKGYLTKEKTQVTSRQIN